MAGNKQFPKWYKGLFAKHKDEKAKAHIIATAIEKCYIFDDAEVPLYPTLVKNIVKRDWEASYTSKMVSLVNAERGLLPSAMVDLTKEDVALMKRYHEDLLNASIVSIS